MAVQYKRYHFKYIKMGPQALLNWMTKSKINLIIFMALLGCGLIYVVNCDLESSDILHPPDGKDRKGFCEKDDECPDNEQCFWKECVNVDSLREDEGGFPNNPDGVTNESDINAFEREENLENGTELNSNQTRLDSSSISINEEGSIKSQTTIDSNSNVSTMPVIPKVTSSTTTPTSNLTNNITGICNKPRLISDGVDSQETYIAIGITVPVILLILVIFLQLRKTFLKCCDDGMYDTYQDVQNSEAQSETSFVVDIDKD